MKFKEYKIKEICKIINGRAYKQEELLQQGKYKVLRVGNFFTSDNWYYSDMELDDDKYCNKGDLLFAWSANFGPKIWNDNKTIFHYHIWKFKLKNNVDRNYLYYTLKDLTEDLKRNTHGSVLPHLTKSEMEEYKIKLPELKEQSKIGNILLKIDKKIELSNQINDSLYELMFTLYQNESSDTENNQEKKLDEFCNIFTGRKNANEFEEDGENKFFTCGDRDLRINSYIYDGPAIIISGNGSYTGRTLFYNGKFDLYQRTYACTLKDDIDENYIYGLFAIIKKDLSDKINGGTHGSAIPYIVMSDLTKFKFEFNEAKFKDFSSQSKAILNKIQANNEQNEVLQQLRDTLLPKLMNGEIDLENIEI